jgi:hypothetical protein
MTITSGGPETIHADAHTAAIVGHPEAIHMSDKSPTRTLTRACGLESGVLSNRSCLDKGRVILGWTSALASVHPAPLPRI